MQIIVVMVSLSHCVCIFVLLLKGKKEDIYVLVSVV